MTTIPTVPRASRLVCVPLLLGCFSCEYNGCYSTATQIPALLPPPVCRHGYRTRQPLPLFAAHGRWYGATRPAATAALPAPGKNCQALYTAPVFSGTNDLG